MAPQNRRATSPASLPPYFKDLQTEVQQLRLDISRHTSVTRELRSIGLETQHLIRTRLRNGAPAQSSISPRTQPQTSTTLSTIRRTRMASKSTTEKVRSAAIAIPKPTQPDSEAIQRVCWYHRQFGQASSHCIQPCTFRAPVVTRRKTQQTPQFLVRVPLERAQPPSTDHVEYDIDMERPASGQTPTPEPATNDVGKTDQEEMAHQTEGSETTGDWNVMQELYEQSFPDLSENSDSDSGSEE